MRQQARIHAGWLDSSNQQAPHRASFPSSAALPASSSHSDAISPSDHLTSDAPAIKSQRPQLPLVPAPRSSSLAGSMGQNQARPNAPSSPLTAKGIALSNAAAATGHKLKRALARRRKASGDIALSSSDTSRNEEKVEEPQDKDASRPPLSARQLASHLHVFGSRKFGKRPASPLPPPLPPKPVALPKKPSSSHAIYRSSIIPLSPSIASAVSYMRSESEEKGRETAVTTQDDEKENHDDPEPTDSREDRRKSDSTMTARPGSHRASRPVSMAESLQSTHTVVPNALRLNSLPKDTEWNTKEAGLSDSLPDHIPSLPASPLSTHRPTSSSIVKAQNRRSLSLNLGPPQSSSHSSPTSLSYTDVTLASSAPITTPERPTKLPPAMTDNATLTSAAAGSTTIVSQAGNQSTNKNIRGRLAAWTAGSYAASFPSQSQATSTPSSDLHRPSPFHRQGVPSSSRQATTSFTSNFAPAAGLAKRAVEKMGRALGGITSSSSSGYSSTSTTSSPASQSSSYTSDPALSRHDSLQSTAAIIDRVTRKTTSHSPSGVRTGASPAVLSSSIADLDAYLTPDGPSLGKQLRAPLLRTGGGTAGLVFGRDLITCCRETPIYSGGYLDPPNSRHRDVTGIASNEIEFVRSLESRMVPAIVVRCAQHLFLWGLHEEGLFRCVSLPRSFDYVMRNLHSVSTVVHSTFRGCVVSLTQASQCDTVFPFYLTRSAGADYDMSGCGPGELDPHAVASVFKAYLRERTSLVLRALFET